MPTMNRAVRGCSPKCTTELHALSTTANPSAHRDTWLDCDSQHIFQIQIHVTLGLWNERGIYHDPATNQACNAREKRSSPHPLVPAAPHGGPPRTRRAGPSPRPLPARPLIRDG